MYIDHLKMGDKVQVYFAFAEKPHRENVTVLFVTKRAPNGEKDGFTWLRYKREDGTFGEIPEQFVLGKVVNDGYGEYEVTPHIEMEMVCGEIKCVVDDIKKKGGTDVTQLERGFRVLKFLSEQTDFSNPVVKGAFEIAMGLKDKKEGK